MVLIQQLIVLHIKQEARLEEHTNIEAMQLLGKDRPERMLNQTKPLDLVMYKKQRFDGDSIQKQKQSIEIMNT